MGGKKEMWLYITFNKSILKEKPHPHQQHLLMFKPIYIPVVQEIY